MSGRYAQVVASEKGLAAWWRMEGNLNDEMGKAPATLRGGPLRFVSGPAGKALALAKGKFITVGKAPHLDLPATTIELLFKLTAKPSGNLNPCLIAKRLTSRNTRFSIHVRRNLERLDLWNGRSVLTAIPPFGPLETGQWYHLAVTADAAGLAVYLDGVQCAMESEGTFAFGAKGLPLQMGASQPDGHEQCRCVLDEVAIYDRVLSQEEIRRHVEALGWGERVAELLRQKAAREARLRREREAQLARRLRDPRLFARGATKVYRGEHLTAISLPVGGIGAGCIQLNGKAERHIWQIFNNFTQPTLPDSFFAVRARAAGGKAVVRAAQTSAVGPFPAMKTLAFRGEYPFGWYDFDDPRLPVAVSLEVFSPLIPLRARDSAIPCAIFNLTAKNTGKKPVEVSFLAAQQNAVGFTGKETISGRKSPAYGRNVNRLVKEGDATILHMTTTRPKTHSGYGDMALTALTAEASGVASWESLDELLADFAADGALSGGAQAGPSPAGETLDGALAVSFTLAPGQSHTASFVLAWHFPNARHGHRRWGGKGNMYANWWDSALAVAREVVERFDELTRLTRLYHETFYSSNLPHWLLDRISSQVAVLRSKTCFWTREGYFGGWEGCNPGGGCCPGSCAHVWHYAQAHARLFPSIARRMRDEALAHQRPDGSIPFRQPAGGIATDGQCGEVLEAYREHLCSPDDSWLKKNWPRIKKAMDFAIARWDKDQDGVLSGPQHNTLDAELGGSTTWLGSLYLAALAASEKMATLEGDTAAAKRYRRIRLSGSKKQDETLWNGEYYIQIPDQRPYRDYLTGCSIDQVLGQWWAHQLDLGWLYPPERVRGALRSVFRYNFRPSFHGFRQAPRKFVADDDAGLLMVTWPRGGRPPAGRCIRYANEVMTGFEYAAAAAMVQAGLLREGFAVVLAVADRYDGRLRTGLTGGNYTSWGYSGNPFGDDECGKFYARAMSVWSLLLACQGFIYDGPAGRIGFRPAWRPEDHASFFTAAEGWGLFSQKRDNGLQTERIEVRYGRLKVRELVFELPQGAKPVKVAVVAGSRRVKAKADFQAPELRLKFARPVVLQAGEALVVETTLAK